MSVEMKILKDRSEWLASRKHTIGGSDASAVVGLNPYKTNVDLWMEKTGQIIPEDISDKPYVKFGIEAEYHMRELFKLDFPEYEVFYQENNLFLNDEYPWGHYSADGWLKDQEGRLGVWENKTTNILQSMQKEKWKNQLPDNYFVQLLHGMAIMEADFAILKARLRSEFKENEVYVQVKHYKIERSEVQADIDYLMQEERKFWQYIENGTRPSLILPEL